MRKNDVNPIPIRDLVVMNIKKYRKLKGITQQELADRCNLSHEYIRRIESNKYSKFCTIQTIKDIADALDIHITLLLMNDDKKEND